jgi:hypothetical protein
MMLPRATRPFAAIMLLLLCFSSVALAETETETTSTSSSSTSTSSTSSTSTSTSGTANLQFAMVPSPLAGGATYKEGNGSASIHAEGTYLSVQFEGEGMASSVRLTLFLVANGTSHSVANMTSSYDGGVESEATISLPPGHYSIGLSVLDTSSFPSPTKVLVSSPGTRPLTLTLSSQSSTTSSETTQSVTTLQGGESEDESINSAIQTKVIPAVVQVGNSGSMVYVNDANFSVSVGRYQQDGYLVSISASNVSGSRVVLVNLTSTQAREIFSGPVMVSLDGSAIQQAGALSQVLGASAGAPARFIIIATTSAIRLLVLIPHFSFHTIEILPLLARTGAALLIDLPALFVAVAAVSVAVVVIYSRRPRIDF